MKKNGYQYGTSLLLAEVLKKHNQYSKSSQLPEVLGDGYLYHFNPYFKNLRDAAITLGADFTSKDYCHQQAVAWASLPQILKTKRLVYFDNVTRLNEIEKLRPKRFRFDEIQIEPDQLHHDGSHLLADAVFSKDFFQKIKHDDADQKEALRAEMAEAISTTQDLMGDFGSHNDLSKAIYRFRTSWSVLHRDAYDIVMQSVGFSGAYKCTFMGYLHGYMLYNQIDKKNMNKIISILFPERRFSAAQLKAMSKIINIGKDVCLRTEVVTSNFYFRLIFEANRDIFDLLNFDFLNLIEKNQDILTRLDGLAEMMQSGLKSKFLKQLKSGAV